MNDRLTNPTDSFVQGIDIHTLLPQQEPFVMIDRLRHFSTDVVTTLYTIKKDNIFDCQDTLSASGLLENIAQTCAARMGYINLSSGKEVRMGVIGALRDMEIQARPKVGSTITTRIEVSDEVFGMTLAKAESRCGDTILVSGTIKIALL